MGLGHFGTYDDSLGLEELRDFSMKLFFRIMGPMLPSSRKIQYSKFMFADLDSKPKGVKFYSKEIDGS